MIKETERISRLFAAAYNGEPWIDVNLVNTLKGISAEEASKQINKQINSIWEITNHLISWRIHMMTRLQDKIINVKGDNYFEKVSDTSEKAWTETLKLLEETQKQWIAFLKKYDEGNLEKINSNNNMTYYEHIHGIIQHDIYHLGQIVLLAKIVKNNIV